MSFYYSARPLFSPHGPVSRCGTGPDLIYMRTACASNERATTCAPPQEIPIQLYGLHRPSVIRGLIKNQSPIIGVVYFRLLTSPLAAGVVLSFRLRITLPQLIIYVVVPDGSFFFEPSIYNGEDIEAKKKASVIFHRRQHNGRRRPHRVYRDTLPPDHRGFDLLDLCRTWVHGFEVIRVERTLLPQSKKMRSTIRPP
jgi:hypothetical protein